jgi:hypothetical protein
MLQNIDTCAGDSLKNACVLCGVNQDLSTKKRCKYLIRLQSGK